MSSVWGMKEDGRVCKFCSGKLFVGIRCHKGDTTVIYHFFRPQIIAKLARPQGSNNYLKTPRNHGDTTVTAVTKAS